jgi:hypothetical protein
VGAGARWVEDTGKSESDFGSVGSLAGSARGCSPAAGLITCGTPPGLGPCSADHPGCLIKWFALCAGGHASYSLHH